MSSPSLPRGRSKSHLPCHGQCGPLYTAERPCPDLSRSRSRSIYFFICIGLFLFICLFLFIFSSLYLSIYIYILSLLSLCPRIYLCVVISFLVAWTMDLISLVLMFLCLSYFHCQAPDAGCHYCDRLSNLHFRIPLICLCVLVTATIRLGRSRNLSMSPSSEDSRGLVRAAARSSCSVHSP